VSRPFHLGDILSVTTGLLVSPGRIAALHELLDFMTNDQLFTHQLPRAAGECKPELLRQHPDLANVPVPDAFRGEDHVNVWMAEQVERYGETREVAALKPGDHTRINPLDELAMLHPGKPVVVVRAEDGERSVTAPEPSPYGLLPCPLPGCDGSLYLNWELSVGLTYDALTGPPPVPGDARVGEWHVECEQGHRPLVPGSVVCPCGRDECTAECNDADVDASDELRTFRASDVARLRQLVGGGEPL